MWLSPKQTLCVRGLNTLLKMPSMYQDQTQIGMFRARELELKALQSWMLRMRCGKIYTFWQTSIKLNRTASILQCVTESEPTLGTWCLWGEAFIWIQVSHNLDNFYTCSFIRYLFTAETCNPTGHKSSSPCIPAALWQLHQPALFISPFMLTSGALGLLCSPR